MEPTTPVVAKKLWKILRIVFLVMRKRISKSKILLDLHHLMTKRGKILEKAMGNLMFHPHSTLSCRSNDAHSTFTGPKFYEFSCSNSPALPHHLTSNKRSSKKHNHNCTSTVAKTNEEEVTAVAAVQKIFEMLNQQVVQGSPMLPGFGATPMVPQLRITDSPFPLRDIDENSSQVDKEADEFIERFYEQLRLQNMMSTPEAHVHKNLSRARSVSSYLK